MTALDCSIILEIVLAEDIAAQERQSRLIDLAQLVARTAPTAELRTAARLRVADLQKGRRS